MYQAVKTKATRGWPQNRAGVVWESTVLALYQLSYRRPKAATGTRTRDLSLSRR